MTFSMHLSVSVTIFYSMVILVVFFHHYTVVVWSILILAASCVSNSVYTVSNRRQI